MLGAVDASKRPLKIPARFVPYMEKHRIYELFHVSFFYHLLNSHSALKSGTLQLYFSF